MSNKITVLVDDFGCVNNPLSSGEVELVKRFTFKNGENGVSIQVIFLICNTLSVL